MQENQQGDGRVDSDSEVLLRESLSALMDGEAQSIELQRILKRCKDDDVLRTTWARYQLTSSLLHRHEIDSSQHLLGFADRVQQALESSHGDARVAVNHRQGFAKFAVAASVAFAVVAGVQWQRHTLLQEQLALAQTVPKSLSSEQQAMTATANATGTVIPPVFLTSKSAERNSQSQQVQFERYMQYHLERASLNDGRGMVPLSRKVSAEER